MTMDKLTAGQSAAFGSLSSPAEVIRAAAQRIVAIQDRQSEMDRDDYYPYADGVEIAGLLSAAMAFNEPDLPIELRALWNALAALVPKHRDLVLGESNAATPKGWPKMSYAVLVDSIRHCLTIKRKVRVPLKPVASLLADYGDDSRKYNYIAKEYARTNRETGQLEGPFLKDGSVQAQLIEQEAAKPGSVVPGGWHPDDGRVEDVLPLIQVCQNAVAALRRYGDSMRTEQVAEYRDPESIEGLLRQMQFPATIARVKGVSEEEVRAVASRLGIRPTESSDPFRPADIHSASDACYRDNMLNPVESPSPSLSPIPETPAADALPVDAGETKLDDLLRRLYESDPDIDTPRAMQTVKNSGLSASAVLVGRTLAEFRRSMTSTK